MQRLFYYVVVIWLGITVYCFKVPKDLTFLGCLFRSPVFNETRSLFPEAPVRSVIPKRTKDHIQFCKQKARKNGNDVFGVDKDICITGSKLKFALPVYFKSKKKNKCEDDIKIFSLAGQLDGIKHVDELNLTVGKQQQGGLELSKRMFITKRVNPQHGGFATNNDNYDTNLLVNGNFELASVATGYVIGWSCQGHEQEFIPMYRNKKLVQSGSFSGVCVKRQMRTDGPGQFIERIVLPEKIYKINGWTKLVGFKNKEEASALELWIRYKSADQLRFEGKLLAKRDKYNNNTGWQFWSSQFFLPKYSNYSSIYLYFQGPEKHVDILIDDMRLTEIPRYQNFNALSDKEIEIFRTRNVTVRVTFDAVKYSIKDLSKAILKVRQVSSDFGFGAAVDFNHLLNNPEYKSFIKNNFHWATMENSLKWNYMEHHQNSVRYEVADKMVETLNKEMGMSIRGHCIYWAIPENNPSWVLNISKMAFKESLYKRMRNVVWRYKSRFQHWDVNNEMLHGWFYSDRLKPGIRNWMFKAAHNADLNAKLFVNDFDVLATPTYTQSYVEQIKSFLEKGIPLAGIGVQGHFFGSVHPEMLRERLDMLSATGLPIWITELDIKEEDEIKRADILENILRAVFSHPAVHGVILWTFWDKHSWRGNHTSLFDGENFTPNSVGRRYLQLRQNWQTPSLEIKPYKVSNNLVLFSSRVYHGNYHFQVVFPDNQMIQKSVEVANHRKPLLVEFRTHVHLPQQRDNGSVTWVG